MSQELHKDSMPQPIDQAPRRFKSKHHRESLAKRIFFAQEKAMAEAAQPSGRPEPDWMSDPTKLPRKPPTANGRP
jgi:hypothetical protein